MTRARIQFLLVPACVLAALVSVFNGIFQMNKNTFCSVIGSKTNAAIFWSRSAGFADRPAGTSALYVQGMSSGGEKQPPSVPPPPQVLEAHLATPHTPSGTFYQLALLQYFWLSLSHLCPSPSWWSSVCSPACFSSSPSVWHLYWCKHKRLGWEVRVSLHIFKKRINGGKGVPHLSNCYPSKSLLLSRCKTLL